MNLFFSLSVLFGASPVNHLWFTSILFVFEPCFATMLVATLSLVKTSNRSHNITDKNPLSYYEPFYIWEMDNSFDK